MKVCIMLAFLMNPVLITLAQETKSPYSGQESLHIKALSHEEIQGYLSGSGMGFARAGELNHYPGPKHVLELGEDLRLSEGQLTQTQQIYDEMQREAVRLGRLYVDKEQELDRLFVENVANERQLKLLIYEIANLKSELRFVHLKAHLKMKQVLSLAQITTYDKLRGYHNSSTSPHHQKH